MRLRRGERARRPIALVLLTLALALGCAGCTGDAGAGQESPPAEEGALILTDYTGHEERFAACPERVVALSGSLGEVWLNAGGTLLGTTEDAVTERGLSLPEETAIVGTIKEPDLERILSLESDFVILSADITSHRELSLTLEELSIPYGLFHEEYFQDYLELLGAFTALTGRSDCYREKGTQVGEEIAQVLSGAPKREGESVLLLRAYSSGFKAKGSDNLTGAMLRDFGLLNVLDRYDSLLEDISLEEILRVDPDYIFVTLMGADSSAAIDCLERELCGDSAWGTLTAVEEGNYHILPKDLFHYKPNARWGEAYAYLAALLEEEQGDLQQ